MRVGTLTALTAAVACIASEAATSPTVARVEVTKRVEANKTHTLVHEVVVDAPIEAVWTAISTPEGWMTWAVPVAWMRKDRTDILETSYDSTAKIGSAGTIQQQFLAQIPGRMLAFRTVKAPAGFPNWETYQLVSSVFELESVGQSGTRVRLTGVGYPDTPAGKQLLEFFEKGNLASLESLHLRFAEGPANWQKRLARPE